MPETYCPGKCVNRPCCAFSIETLGEIRRDVFLGKTLNDILEFGKEKDLCEVRLKAARNIYSREAICDFCGTIHH